MGLSKLTIGLIVLFSIISILVLAGVIFAVWWFWPSSTVVLPEPVGEMSIVSGPFPDKNAIPGGALGTIDHALFKARNVYGMYGYRGILKNEDLEIIDVSTGKIAWNENMYHVHSITEVQKGGFTFKVPSQVDALEGSDIYYQLIGTFYDNLEGTGDPLYTELVLGEVLSTATPLLLVESAVPAVNKNLTL